MQHMEPIRMRSNDDFSSFDPFGTGNTKKTEYSENNNADNSEAIKTTNNGSAEEDFFIPHSYEFDDGNSFEFFDDDEPLTGDDDGDDAPIFDNDGDEDVKIYHAGDASAAGFGMTGSKPIRGAAGEQEPSQPDKDSDFDTDYFNTVYTDNGKGLKTAAVAIAVVLGIVLVVFLAYRYVRNNIIGDDSTIYEGVYINGYSVAGMTEAEVCEYIKQTYNEPIEKANVTVKLGDTEKVYPLTDFVICDDAEDLAKQVYNVARDGTEKERIKAITDLKTNPVNFVIQYEITHEKLTEIIELAEKNGFEAVVDPTYDVRDTGVVFTSGKNGSRVDIAQFKSDLNDMMAAFEEDIRNVSSSSKIDNAVVEIKTEETGFTPLSADDILKAVETAPVDAYYYKEGTGKNTVIKVKSSEQGRTLDIVELNSIVTRINSGEDLPYFLLTYTKVEAEVTTEALEERLFATELSMVLSENEADGFSTDTKGGRAERAENFKRACELFGTVYLMPNEEVSVLDKIGNISTANSFIYAVENVCDEGKAIVGGGISQFATALYEAALKAGLDVVRNSHCEYYPNYGMAGFDAYVSTTGGSYDLIIKNKTDEPVKIETRFTDSTVVVTVSGGAEAGVSLSSMETEVKLNSLNTGTNYKYRISKIAGGTETVLGNVTYLKLGEGVVIPETETPTEEQSETPTEEQSETPTLEPSETPTEEISETPDESDLPTETPEVTETAGETETESETPTETATESTGPTEESSESPTETVSESPSESSESSSESSESPSENPDVSPSADIPTETAEE